MKEQSEYLDVHGYQTNLEALVCAESLSNVLEDSLTGLCWRLALWAQRARKHLAAVMVPFSVCRLQSS